MAEELHPKLVYFVQKTCTDQWKIRNHHVETYCLVFIQKGSADYQIDGEAVHVEAGDILFIRPGSTRSASTQGMYCTALDFLLPAGEDVQMDQVRHYGNFAGFHWLFQELYYEWLQRKEGYQLKCQAIFALILHQILYGSDGHHNAYINQIKRYVVDHYNEELTLDQLADITGLSSVYCGALFKKVEGQSIHTFISRVRMNQAMMLLRNGEYTVSEVAEKVGFKDVYYFSNSFKKFAGISPSAYKKRPK